METRSIKLASLLVLDAVEVKLQISGEGVNETLFFFTESVFTFIQFSFGAHFSHALPSPFAFFHVLADSSVHLNLHQVARSFKLCEKLPWNECTVHGLEFANP